MENGAALLGGDSKVTFTYRFATDAERQILNANAAKVSEIADFRSMVSAQSRRVLTQIKAMDIAYPLTGQITLDPPQSLTEAFAVQDGPARLHGQKKPPS